MADERQSGQGDITHIRVQGSLDEKWADWFEGFVMTSRQDGATLLSGRVADPAALHGALARIHGLGLPLLLVARIECPCPKRKCPRRGRCEECAAYHGANGKLPYCFRARTRWGRQCAALTEGR